MTTFDAPCRAWGGGYLLCSTTIGPHRRNSARDLDARSLTAHQLNSLQRYLSERLIGPAAQHVLRHPWSFLWQAIKGFRANQGLLLAGAVAYYALLSIVPLLILTVIALSHLIDQHELLDTLGRYLEWLVPGQSKGIVGELANFLDKRQGVGWLLLGTMIFFSSLAFTVLENAMSVIFLHRVVAKKRRFIFSVLIPYVYILSLGIGLLLVTLVAGSLQGVGKDERRAVRPRVVAARRLGPPALLARSRRRDFRPDLGLPGHANRPARLAPCADRRRHRDAALGDHAPRAGLVLRHAVAGDRRLRLADDGDHRAVEPRDRGDAAAVRCASDLGVRADRPRRAEAR